MKLRTVSIVDAEIAVRSRVDADLAALPASLTPGEPDRMRILRYHVDQQARAMVKEILGDADSTTPGDVEARLTEPMVQMLKEEIARAVGA